MTGWGMFLNIIRQGLPNYSVRHHAHMPGPLLSRTISWKDNATPRIEPFKCQ
jgi:hypothetical protein